MKGGVYRMLTTEMEKSNILLKIILRLLADKQYIEYPCKYD